MAHFDNLNQHRRRVHNLAARVTTVTSSVHTTSTTNAALINPIAPTIVINTSTSSSVSSPSPVVTPSTTSSATSPSSTSTSLSTSSTLTTSSTTPIVSSSTPVLSTLTSTTPLTHLTSSTPTTTTFIQTVGNPSSVGLSSSVFPSPTSSSTSNGTSSGIIIGGVIAAILGTAGILAAVVYFLRKCRGREDEAFGEEIWNRGDARRQSAILGDGSESLRGYDAPPRPPSMIERHIHNQSPRQPNLPSMHHPYNAYGASYGAPTYPTNSFSPGQVVTPTSANPFFSPYAQDVMGSPVSSTVPEYHDPPRSGHPALPPQALTREPSIGADQVAVARQNSVTGGPFNPVVSSPDAADPQYTDLSRSSVTPFQAAQYAEITEKLGAPMSSVLGAVPEEPQAVTSDNITPSTEAEDTYTESPFTDAVAVQQPIGDEADDDLPLPSPNAFHQTRIASLPPTLPEINVPERSFSPVASLEFPVPLSVRNSPSPNSAEFSDLRGPSPTQPTYKSSPLATSNPMQAQAQATVIPREPKSEAAPAARPDTVYTVYDEEDAYGGM